MQGKKEAFIYLATKIVMGVVGVFSITVQTTYVEPGVLGDFSLITGFTGILFSIFIGWISSSAMRYYDFYKDKNAKGFFTTIHIDWLAMLLVVGMIILVSSFFVKTMPIKQNLILIIVMIVFTSGVEIYERLMRVAGRSYSYSVLMMLQSVLNIILVIVLFRYTVLKIEALFLTKIIVSALFVFVAFAMLKVLKQVSIKSYSREMNKMFFAYGFPMVGVWGVSWLLNYADRYIIRVFMTSHEVGLYDVSYRFAESSIGLIISAFNLAFFPQMIKCWNEKGKDGVCKMVRGVFNYLFMFSVPAVVGISLLSNQFYGTIIDMQYKQAAVVIAISSVGFVFMGVNGTLYKLWQLEEKTKAVLYLTIFSVVINLTTNIIFIPRFGYVAAAVTTVVSYVSVTILTAVLLRKRFPFSLDIKMLAKQVISSVVMGVFILAVRGQIQTILGLALVIVGASVVYFICLMLLGGLKEEIKVVLSKRKK